ncbi:glycosyltransferase [Roseibium aggregatum]|uniref:glycosyltransferase n=1 Tax=Roseibium aggregatum TaxID=187304 RepID=UPI001A8E2369|nr:glycosyltransferase [Roseibium aggregatum]MBN8181388.1 glycosyltransferase [Roseibium aggregatum]
MQADRRPLRILMTNNTLDQPAGSELYLRDLALALMRRGHFPVAYSQSLGPVADRLRAATIPVVDDLRDLSAVPDVIHGQHHLETMTAALRFPQVPVTYTCHGWIPWQEWPPVFPNILHYVAVDDLCRERLLTSAGVPADQISVLHNFVDLDRFRKVRDLPDKPKSALVFSNSAAQVPKAIRDACTRMGIERVDIVGQNSGRSAVHPETILADYDVVFAKARAAIEAMASGCAVVVMDYGQLGGLVGSSNLQRMRGLNFGIRTLQNQLLHQDKIERELERYDASDARVVTQWIRSNAGLEAAVDRWLEIYYRTIERWSDVAGTLHDGERLASASRYVSQLAPRVKAKEQAEHCKNLAEADLRAAKAQLERDTAVAASNDARHKTRIAELEREVQGLKRGLERHRFPGLAVRMAWQGFEKQVLKPCRRHIASFRKSKS